MLKRPAGWILAGITSVFLSNPIAPCEAKEPRSAREFFERGVLRYSARDFDGAIEDFTSVITLNSNVGDRSSTAAPRVKSDLKDKKQTGSQDKILVHDKLNAVACYNRGRARMAKGDLSGALIDFDDAITMNPHDGWAFNNRGYVKWMTGDAAGAIGDYDRAVQLGANDATAYLTRGIFRRDSRDLAGAIADFSRAIELEPGLAAAFHNRANVQVLRGMLDEALRDYSRAIELDSGLWVAYLNRGLALTLQGRESEARRDFECYLRHSGDAEESVKKLAQQAREASLARQR